MNYIIIYFIVSSILCTANSIIVMTFYKNKLIKIEEENKSLKTNIKTLKRRRKKQTSKKNKYKDRINKAIEFIEKDLNDVWDDADYPPDELLEILKGSEE